MIEHTGSGRHLAAILFTDIAGYTAMMQRNEREALAAVRRHQEVLEHFIPAYEGRINQYYGDGSLSIFSSATQAVRCALEIQKALRQEPALPLRIGMHIGEIYYEDGKIFGDGVNIASRIESIGQPGTVFFSREVYEKIRNHHEFVVLPVGTFAFKNVHEPIDVFALSNPEIRQPDLKHIEGKLKPAPATKRHLVPVILGSLLIGLIAFYALFLRPKERQDPADSMTVRQSIAVLPFINLSDGKEADFLSTGIAEDILTQLAQIKDLKVISRSSTIRYKDSDKPIRTIAKELGVTSILEGSVRKYDDNLRISVQLTDAMNETLIWAADFDKQFKDVLNVQRDVALAVSDKLKVALSPSLQHRLRDKTLVDPESYMQYQKGQELLSQSSGSREDMEQAIQYFETATQLDSAFSRAWIGLADAYIEAIFWHRVDAEPALEKAKKAAERALAIDPETGEGYGALGAILYVNRNYREAEPYLAKALELTPNNYFASERLGWIRVMQGHYEEGLRLIYKAIELNPLSTRMKGSLGNAYSVMGRYPEGVRLMKEYLVTDPGDNYLLWTLGLNQVMNGEYAEAVETLKRRTIKGAQDNWVLCYAYAKAGERKAAEDILQRNLEKSKTAIVPFFMLAVQYCGLGNYPKTLEYLAKGVDDKGENFFVINLDKDPIFQPLWNDPAFKKIVEKVKKDFTF